MLIKRNLLICLLIILIAFPPLVCANVRSDTNRFAGGFQRVLLAPLHLPVQMLRGTFNGPPLLGTVGGLFSGTIGTLTNIVGGVFDMTAASAPYAKYAVFAL